MKTGTLFAALISTALIAAAGLEAQPLFPLGEEVALPPPQTCPHRDPRVAWTPGGEVLAVWDSGPEGIVARSSPGQVIDFGPEMPLSGDDLGPAYPAVAALADGDFLASWVRGPFLDKEIVLQRFDRHGAPQTPKAVIAAHRHPWGGAEIGLQDGELVLAWAEHAHAGDPAAVKLRRATVDAVPLGSEVTVTDSGTHSLASVELMVGEDGSFLVAWNRLAGVPTSTREVFVQAFEPDGAPAAAIVSLTAPLYRRPTAIAAAAWPGGGYLVGWTDPGDPPGDEDRVLVQRLDPLGQPLGPPERVDPPGNGTVYDGPRIGAGDDGAVVGWVRGSDNDHADAYGRRLDREGRPVGEGFAVNRTVGETFGESHHLASLDLDLANGRLAAAWQIYRVVPILPSDCDIGVSTVAQTFKMAPDITDVPTLSQLALGYLALLLAVAGVRTLRRRQ